MQIGARAMKENKISVEDVDLCLRDLQESIDSQKEVEKALGTFFFSHIFCGMHLICAFALVMLKWIVGDIELEGISGCW